MQLSSMELTWGVPVVEFATVLESCSLLKTNSALPIGVSRNYVPLKIVVLIMSLVSRHAPIPITASLRTGTISMIKPPLPFADVYNEHESPIQMMQ